MDVEKLSLKEIKEMINASGEAREELKKALALDRRQGAQRFLSQLKEREKELEKETCRLAGLFKWEKKLFDQGITLVAGVDEAGRGPLAGPVVACAVVLPRGCFVPGLNDSKKLTSSQRRVLAAHIKNIAPAWAVGMSTVGEIDRYNIHRAGLLAMRRAVEGLNAVPGHLLIDGFGIPGLDIPQTAIKGGDALCASIAAASILAKETRDLMIRGYHRLYPHYGFDRHKGYGTPEHLAALLRYGPCPWHRLSFAPVRETPGAGELKERYFFLRKEG